MPNGCAGSNPAFGIFFLKCKTKPIFGRRKRYEVFTRLGENFHDVPRNEYPGFEHCNCSGRLPGTIEEIQGRFHSHLQGKSGKAETEG